MLAAANSHVFAALLAGVGAALAGPNLHSMAQAQARQIEGNDPLENPPSRQSRPKVAALYGFVTTGLTLAATARFEAKLEWLPYALSTPAMVALAFIDVTHKVLPRRLIYLGAALTYLAITTFALANDSPRVMFNAASGVMLSAGFCAVVWLISPSGLGFGDVRLQLITGSLSGMAGLATAATGLFFSFTLSAVAGLALVASRKAGLKTGLPAGPSFMVGHLLAAFLAGSALGH